MRDYYRAKRAKLIAQGVSWRDYGYERRSNKKCPTCDTDFVAIRDQRFCSKRCCRRYYISPELNPNWKPTKHKNGGYIEVKVPSDGRTHDGFMREHRLVMERYLGRKLDKNEWVHHRNGDKTDNRLENLEIVTVSNHFGNVKCPKCRYDFVLK